VRRLSLSDELPERTFSLAQPGSIMSAIATREAGLQHAIAKGWLHLHESGTYVRFADAGAALFA
jgi:hypothetical protein